jgi:hypothetical protein
MLASIIALALIAQDPGGPKLDAKTSTTSTSTAARTPKKPKSKRRGILGINVVNIGGQVRVKSIKRGGAAAKAGIEKWDAILSIDGKPVKDRREYVFLMAGKRGGEDVVVEWKGDDNAVHKKSIVLEGGRRIIEHDEDRDDDRRERKKSRRAHVRRKPKVKTTKWYGWQGIVSDVPSLLFMVSGLIVDNTIVSGIGLVGYSIGTPLTHFFHDNVGRGLISLSLRVGIPALTVLGTIGICDETRVCSDAAPLAVIGGLIMFVAVPAVDAAALSWQKLEPQRETSVNISLVPAVAPAGEDGVTFGLAGAF